MGLFDRFKKHDDAPDFSAHDPGPDLGAQPQPDPLSQGFSYDEQATPFDSGLPDRQFNPGQEYPQGEHPFAEQPAPGDKARAYAAGLTRTGPDPAAREQAYGRAVAGHEGQLILERLDTIKAELDGIKQRMLRIERYMDQHDKKLY